MSQHTPPSYRKPTGSHPLVSSEIRERLAAPAPRHLVGWWDDCGFDDPKLPERVFKKLLVMVQTHVLSSGFPADKFVFSPRVLSHYLDIYEFIWLRDSCFKDGRLYGEDVFTAEQCLALKGTAVKETYAGVYGKWERSACAAGMDLRLEI